MQKASGNSDTKSTEFPEALLIGKQASLAKRLIPGPSHSFPRDPINSMIIAPLFSALASTTSALSSPAEPLHP